MFSFYVFANRYKVYLNEKNFKTLINDQLADLSYYSIISLGIIFSLVILGIEMSNIITLLASFTIILGLAFQNILTNLFSGIYIVINDLFRIDDDIELKPLSFCKFLKGKISNFNLFFTEVKNENGDIQIIPNSLIQNNILVNLSKHSNYS